MKLSQKLKSKPNGLLSIYTSAGYPQLDSLPQILETLESAGVDFVEVGIPYSDPISDGPIIQSSSAQALNNGISLEGIFQQLETSRASVPVVMMGYFNSLLQYGVESFCKRCQSLQIEAVIVPDLPIEYYLSSYKEVFEQYGLTNIFLITPETPESRIRWIDQHSTGFIYAVSSSSTTGKGIGIQGAETYLKRLNKMNLSQPLLVGFNVSTPHDVAFANKYANGCIIGSAFIDRLKADGPLQKLIPEFITHLQQVSK